MHDARVQQAALTDLRVAIQRDPRDERVPAPMLTRSSSTQPGPTKTPAPMRHPGRCSSPRRSTPSDRCARPLRSRPTDAARRQTPVPGSGTARCAHTSRTGLAAINAFVATGRGTRSVEHDRGRARRREVLAVLGVGEERQRPRRRRPAASRRRSITTSGSPRSSQPKRTASSPSRAGMFVHPRGRAGAAASGLRRRGRRDSSTAVRSAPGW